MELNSLSGIQRNPIRLDSRSTDYGTDCFWLTPIFPPACPVGRDPEFIISFIAGELLDLFVYSRKCHKKDFIIPRKELL
ncbi:MAG: hypothetical protein ISR96_02355 [Nitrospira sp.]|nr:hypothetical protein [Nitrospira sp.]